MVRSRTDVRTGLTRLFRLTAVLVLAAMMLPLGVPCASAGAGTPDTYWVDVATGSDGNSGAETAPFKTITHAAAVADRADTIKVKPGTYSAATGEVWPISFDGETLVSTGGASVTILNGDGTHQLLRFQGWWYSDRLQGFDIRNGGAVSTDAAVAVLVGESVDPAYPVQIADCIFSDNSGGFGGALLISLGRGSCLIVSGNQFRDNVGVTGGAIWATSSGGLMLTDNEFTGNTATDGGAVSVLTADGQTRFFNNTFTGNTANGSGGAVQWTSDAGFTIMDMKDNAFTGNHAVTGGAVYLDGLVVDLERNEAVANVAGVGGAGFAFLNKASVDACSNYLAQNQSGSGGSVWSLTGYSDLDEINDTVAGNTGGSCATYAPGLYDASIMNCIYWNPDSPTELSGVENVSYTCSADDLATLTAGGNTIGAGMVYADPRLSATNPPALLSDSTCIETANPSDYASTDLFGRTRPLDGDADGVALPDIGCYELPKPVPPVAPVAVYRFYNFTNNTHFLTDSATERDMVIATWPKVFSFEGVAYYVNPANNTQPLTRLYNRVRGCHFYTAVPGEAVLALRNWPTVYQLDGLTYAVNPSPVPNSTPVYRFFNVRNGSHFYTASETEKSDVIAKYPTVYQYEGPAFWIGQ